MSRFAPDRGARVSSAPLFLAYVDEQMRAMETFDKLRAFNGVDYLTEPMVKVVTVENIGPRSSSSRHRLSAGRRRPF
jgi:hypothetical protein